MTITALMSGFLPKMMYYALAKYPPKTMDEIMARAGKIMKAEKAMAAKYSLATKSNAKYKRKEQRDHKESNEQRENKEEKILRYGNYTLLSVGIHHTLEEIKHNKELR